jgi:hypothetical protein
MIDKSRVPLANLSFASPAPLFYFLSPYFAYYTCTGFRVLTTPIHKQKNPYV